MALGVAVIAFVSNKCTLYSLHTHVQYTNLPLLLIKNS